jgi:WW domain
MQDKSKTQRKQPKQRTQQPAADSAMAIDDAQPSQQAQREEAAPQWQQAFDPTTWRYYYFNEATRTTQWGVPAAGFRHAPPEWRAEAFVRRRDGSAAPADQPSPPRKRPPMPLAPAEAEDDSRPAANVGGGGGCSSDGGGASGADGVRIEAPAAWQGIEGGAGIHSLVPEGAAAPGFPKKPRMESTGMMAGGIPVPEGHHTRFGSEASEGSQELDASAAAAPGEVGSSSVGAAFLGHKSLVAQGVLL